jgi:predicted RNase H-like HicB family nuclease
MGVKIEAIVDVHREGRWYVAEDLVTNVADQGRTPADAIRNLKRGLRGHYRVLLEVARSRGMAVVEVGLTRSSGPA